MITSRDNSHLKHARAVRGGKSPGEIFLEGLRLCEEAVRSGISITEVLYTSDLALEPRGKTLLAALRNIGSEPLLVPEKLLETVSDTNTPQGIVIIAARPAADRSALNIGRGELPLIVVLHEMNNPSNLGAVLRTAEAAGVRGVIVSKNSADPFSPKALRGAMGASLRLPVWHGAEFAEAVQYCKQNKMAVTCADVNGKLAYTEIDWQKPCALVIGSEAHGLSDADIALCDHSFRIPMAGPVESLNAAVAAGIVMFEARRQFLLRMRSVPGT
jgi:TrmH family RNA methyltransferase